MDKNKLFLIGIASFLAAALLSVSLFFGAKYYFEKEKLYELSANINKNNAIKIFNNIFIEKVLKAKGEVSYEDRLELESAAVSAGKEILDQWHYLLESQTEQEAQERVIGLLLLFSKEL